MQKNANLGSTLTVRFSEGDLARLRHLCGPDKRHKSLGALIRRGVFLLAEAEAGDKQTCLLWSFADNDHAHTLVVQLKRLGGLLNQYVRVMNTLAAATSGSNPPQLNGLPSANDVNRLATDISELGKQIKAWHVGLEARFGLPLRQDGRGVRRHRENLS